MSVQEHPSAPSLDAAHQFTLFTFICCFWPSYKTISGVSFPIIIAGISETVVEVTDTIFLAHYGMTELAAVGVAASIYGAALFLTLGLVDGIQIIVARRAGEGRNHQVGEFFNQGIYML